MLEVIIVALLVGMISGIGIALFSRQKVAKLGAENEMLKAKIADLEIHREYVANTQANVQKQYRALNK